MNKKLAEKFDQLEKNRVDLLQDLRRIDSRVLHEKPNVDSWSIVQVLDHLREAERGSLSYLQKKIQADTLPASGLMSFIRIVLLRLIMNGSVKFKAPNVVSNPKDKSLNEIENDWDEVRAELQEFLDNYPDDKMGKAIYKHPLVGRITLINALEFFNIHINHHRKQIRKLKEA